MENLIDLIKSRIPSLDAILEQAFGELKLSAHDVKNEFGRVLVSLDERATYIFKECERQALIELAKGWMENQRGTLRKRLEKILAERGWQNFVKEASQLFVEFGMLVQSLEKDLGNMRKARGGKTFEKAILKLLNFIHIKGETPIGKEREKLRRIDIVIPSIKTALETSDKAIFLTCKRTLRERWKQEIPQVKLNERIYLLTIDNTLSESKAREIAQKGLIAFVKDDLKSREIFKDMTWIRKLSDLPEELRGL